MAFRGFSLCAHSKQPLVSEHRSLMGLDPGICCSNWSGVVIIFKIASPIWGSVRELELQKCFE